MKNKIVIAGGGIAGLTTAIALQRIGMEPIVFEGAPFVNAAGAGLGLAANAIKGFHKLGIADAITERGRFLNAFTIYDGRGKKITRTNTKRVSEKYGLDNFTIHRAALHQVLLSYIDPSAIQTNKRLVDVAEYDKSLLLKFQDGTMYQADYLVAADGIHSAVRQKLLPASKPRYAGYTCWRGVVTDPSVVLEEAGEYWGKGCRFGVAPLAGNQVYWFACVNAPQKDERMKNLSQASLIHMFKDFPDPVPALLQKTPREKMLWNDILDLEPIHQYAFNNIVLTGDAAHATTPNMGQGACQAVEDAVILADALQHNTDIPVAFKEFETRRLERTHFIINNSRRIGQAAQLENSFLISLRNMIFRSLPSSVNERQLKKLYTVDF